MLSYKQRAELCQNSLAKQLFSLMEKKQTNLCVAVDVTSSQELIRLAGLLGDEICLLKTHVDILEDFTPEVMQELSDLADKQGFLLFEDRKFADIGNTVSYQYGGGVHKIADWAHITNAHIVPGPGIIAGLKKIGLPKGRGLLLLAQMSSAGTLADGAYTDAAIRMAEAHSDFVMGFICVKKLSEDPTWVHMTPGIGLSQGGDTLGQQYQTPEQAIKAGTDVIIVGRGIYEAEDPKSQAQLYRSAGWQAYVDTLQ